MAEGSRAGVVAAVLAERDAQERGGDGAVPPQRRALVLGTGLGPLLTTGEFMALLAREGPRGAEPFLFIESLHNSPAGHACIVLDCKGPTLTPVSGDASGLAAVIEGVNLIREWRADRAYAGGWEEIPPFFVGHLAQLLPPGRSIPLLGAGAAVFRLEADPARGKPYAWIVSSARGHDPTARDLDYGTDPSVPRRVLEGALKGAGWRREDVDLLLTAENGFATLGVLEERVYSDWPVPSQSAGSGRRRPALTFGALAGSGSLIVAAAALALVEGRENCRRVLVCLPSWGGGCQALALSSTPD